MLDATHSTVLHATMPGTQTESEGDLSGEASACSNSSAGAGTSASDSASSSRTTHHGECGFWIRQLAPALTILANAKMNETHTLENLGDVDSDDRADLAKRYAEARIKEMTAEATLTESKADLNQADVRFTNTKRKSYVVLHVLDDLSGVAGSYLGATRISSNISTSAAGGNSSGSSLNNSTSVVGGGAEMNGSGNSTNNVTSKGGNVSGSGNSSNSNVAQGGAGGKGGQGGQGGAGGNSSSSATGGAGGNGGDSSAKAAGGNAQGGNSFERYRRELRRDRRKFERNRWKVRFIFVSEFQFGLEVDRRLQRKRRIEFRGKCESVSVTIADRAAAGRFWWQQTTMPTKRRSLSNSSSSFFNRGPFSLTSEAGPLFYFGLGGISAICNPKLNVDPFPSSEVTQIVPPIFSTISLTIKSPRPVPTISLVLSVVTR